MDYPMNIDTISIELSILYFKGLPVKTSIKWCIAVPKDCFHLNKQCRLWCNAAWCDIASGSSLLAIVPVNWYPEWTGIISLIQDFEADFLWKVSLEILNSVKILKNFIHAVIWIWFHGPSQFCKWTATLDFQQNGMCDQQILRSACAYVQSDQRLC